VVVVVVVVVVGGGGGGGGGVAAATVSAIREIVIYYTTPCISLHTAYALNIKIVVVWNVKPCSLVQYFGIDVQTNILPLPPPQHGNGMRFPSRFIQILYSFKTPVPIYQTTRCHIPKYRIFKPIQHSVYLIPSENLEA